MRDEQPLAESISNIPRLSPAYRSALAMWLATDGSPIAFESLVAPAVARQQTRSLWNLSFLQPLVILAISYVVMIYICSFTIPKLEAIYEQSGHQPHFASAVMIGLRKSMMIWIPSIPIFVGVFFFLRKKPSEIRPNRSMRLQKVFKGAVESSMPSMPSRLPSSSRAMLRCRGSRNHPKRSSDCIELDRCKNLLGIPFFASDASMGSFRRIGHSKDSFASDGGGNLSEAGKVFNATDFEIGFLLLRWAFSEDASCLEWASAFSGRWPNYFTS